MSNNLEQKIRNFVEKLEFTDDEIKDYAKEYELSEENMRRMARRISDELKHDLNNAMSEE